MSDLGQMNPRLRNQRIRLRRPRKYTVIVCETGMMLEIDIEMSELPVGVDLRAGRSENYVGSSWLINHSLAPDVQAYSHLKGYHFEEWISKIRGIFHLAASKEDYNSKISHNSTEVISASMASSVKCANRSRACKCPVANG